MLHDCMLYFLLFSHPYWVYTNDQYSNVVHFQSGNMSEEKAEPKMEVEVKADKEARFVLQCLLLLL